MSVWAIVVAGGSGSRFGAEKQTALLDGRRLVDWAAAAARESCDGVVVVMPPASADVESGAAVAGGETRSASVRNGLAAVPEDADVIVVHDAARPLAPISLFRSVIDAVVAGADGAIPALSVGDTIKRVDGDTVVRTLDRANLVAVQTPQAFRADLLRRAHAGQGEGTDDAALVEAGGGKVIVVAGDPVNMKITNPGDLRVLAVLVGERS